MLVNANGELFRHKKFEKTEKIDYEPFSFSENVIKKAHIIRRIIVSSLV